MLEIIIRTFVRKHERRYFYKKMLNVSYAKRLLENYSLNKAAEENFPFEMTMINSRVYSSCSEKTMVEMIEAKDRLVARTDRAKKEIKQTESALSALSPYQRELLNAFYVAGAHSGAENIAGRYNVERSTVYRDKNKALVAFANSIGTA